MEILLDMCVKPQMTNIIYIIIILLTVYIMEESKKKWHILGTG